MLHVPEAPGEGTHELARVFLRIGVNYFHCLEPAPPGTPAYAAGSVAALTGEGPRQCDVVAVVDLHLGPTQLDASPPRTRRLAVGSLVATIAALPEAGLPKGLPGRIQSVDGDDGDLGLVDVVFENGHHAKVSRTSLREIVVVEPTPRTRALKNRAALSVSWARGADGRDLLLVNTRPRVGGVPALLAGEAPAPALGTAIELMVLDAATLTTLTIHGGHHAFTTADAPFILHAEAWADGDLVASGGEDCCVHVWHRRHGRQLQRLEGHTQAVNKVSWCVSRGLLASASDDHSVLLWGCSGAGG